MRSAYVLQLCRDVYASASQMVADSDSPILRAKADVFKKDLVKACASGPLCRVISRVDIAFLEEAPWVSVWSQVLSKVSDPAFQVDDLQVVEGLAKVLAGFHGKVMHMPSPLTPAGAKRGAPTTPGTPTTMMPRTPPRGPGIPGTPGTPATAAAPATPVHLLAGLQSIPTEVMDLQPLRQLFEFNDDAAVGDQNALSVRRMCIALEKYLFELCFGAGKDSWQDAVLTDIFRSPVALYTQKPSVGKQVCKRPDAYWKHQVPRHPESEKQAPAFSWQPRHKTYALRVWPRCASAPQKNVGFCLLG
jgi:hypothetical protein